TWGLLGCTATDHTGTAGSPAEIGFHDAPPSGVRHSCWMSQPANAAYAMSGFWGSTAIRLTGRAGSPLPTFSGVPQPWGAAERVVVRQIWPLSILRSSPTDVSTPVPSHITS